MRFKPLLQLPHKACLGHIQGMVHLLLRGIRFPVPEIISDGSGKQPCLLGDIGNF